MSHEKRKKGKNINTQSPEVKENIRLQRVADEKKGAAGRRFIEFFGIKAHDSRTKEEKAADALEEARKKRKKEMEENNSPKPKENNKPKQ